MERQTETGIQTEAEIDRDGETTERTEKETTEVMKLKDTVQWTRTNTQTGGHRETTDQAQNQQDRERQGYMGFPVSPACPIHLLSSINRATLLAMSVLDSSPALSIVVLAVAALRLAALDRAASRL